MLIVILADPCLSHRLALSRRFRALMVEFLWTHTLGAPWYRIRSASVHLLLTLGVATLSGTRASPI
jgi:hypothetical protein